MVLSVDRENDPDIVAVIAASAALSVSDIPFRGPIGAVRMGYCDGQLVVNPTYKELEKSQLNMVVVGTREAIVMVEGGANELPEALVLAALETAHQALQSCIDIQLQLQEVSGKPKIAAVSLPQDTQLQQQLHDMAYARLQAALATTGKLERQELMHALEQEVVKTLAADTEGQDRHSGSKPLKPFFMIWKVLRCAGRSSWKDGVLTDAGRPTFVPLVVACPSYLAPMVRPCLHVARPRPWWSRPSGRKEMNRSLMISKGNPRKVSCSIITSRLIALVKLARNAVQGAAKLVMGR